MRAPLDRRDGNRRPGVLVRCLAVGLSVLTVLPAQQAGIDAARPPASVVLRPYLAPEVPPARLGNSSRLEDLVRAGTLYLTAQDAIALALENNIDLEVARYNPVMAQWNLERSQAGGALPGVPSSASQAGSVAAGQGVAGSQTAAGVSGGGGGGGGGASTNATISQIGPVTQTLDPSFQEASTFSHKSTPQTNLSQSLTSVLISNTRVHSGSFQEGFLSGGSATLSFSDHYLAENAPSDILNPSVAPNLSLSAQHNLLRGFGVAVNARFITVARRNLAISDLSFKAQVISLVTQVLNLYFGLAGSYEDLRAKREAAQVARTFFDNVREQIRIGSIAPTDEITAQVQVVTSAQAVVDSEVSLEQQEVRLKNLISRTGTADPLLRNVRIVPVDPIRIPASDDLRPEAELVAQALSNRADLAVEQANLESREISALGTRNGVEPTLVVFGSASQAGLGGTPQPGVPVGSPAGANSYFVGGMGTALGQMFRRNFPTESVGAFYMESIGNRQAQADFAIDQLQFRQSQLTTRRDLNQVEVDVRNYVVALRQARARYETAVGNRVLQQELFSAEQKKYSLGSSTPYNVIVAQRDLATAQNAVTAALIAHSNARVALDQAVGVTLETNQVSIAEVRQGRLARRSAPAPEPAKP